MLVPRCRFRQATDTTIQELYGLPVTDEMRNEQIINDVLLAMEEGRSPILLIERREHLEQLYNRLKSFVRHVVTFTTAWRGSSAPGMRWRAA